MCISHTHISLFLKIFFRQSRTHGFQSISLFQPLLGLTTPGFPMTKAEFLSTEHLVKSYVGHQSYWHDYFGADATLSDRQYSPIYLP